MKLKNSFSSKTRNLYLYRTDCDLCGSNQMLELHHITGREDDSPFNASLVCHNCHSHLNHNQEEERHLFLKNLQFLKSEKYEVTDKDLQFLVKHQRLITNKLEQWLLSK